LPRVIGVLMPLLESSIVMEEFFRTLQSYAKGSQSRNWLLVLDDQLSDEMGPLSREHPQELGIVLIESYWKARRRPYHKQKLAFHFLNLRHFALEQAKRGVAVHFLTTSQPYRNALIPIIERLGCLRVMEPAELEVMRDLLPLVKKKLINMIPHEGWLTSREHFLNGAGKHPPWRMNAFYRHVRQQTGILMSEGRPLGGRYSFDTENRQPWKGEPPAPQSFCFPPETIKDEVITLIESQFGDHPGQVHPESLPGTKVDAFCQWAWCQKYCLPHFGPYEDAMAEKESGLFHSRMAALINIHRVLPSQIMKDVVSLGIPLPSKEGFIRQVLGWREFVYHVHKETDGFRKQFSSVSLPGDAGYTKWCNQNWKASKNLRNGDGGAKPSFWKTEKPLPATFWGAPSGLHCLDIVIGQVWEQAYSHHITRLMILSNIATLLDVSPRELTDWFWVAYVDAFDWVVEPNVLAMGTFGTGPLMTTKPYISGAAYIHRMSDFCDTCAFNPKTNCPITHLYWAFLERHKKQLQTNPRMRLPLRNLQKRGRPKIRRDFEIFEIVHSVLEANQRLTPRHFITTGSTHIKKNLSHLPLKKCKKADNR